MEMKTLLNKYKNDQLTPTELYELREKINSGNSAELEQLLQADWFAFQEPTTNGDKEPNYEQLFERIQEAVRPVKKTIDWLRVWQYAAILLLPVLLFSTYHFYQKATVAARQEMVIETGPGERANITLPDGTFVNLNTTSRLSYNPTEFNKDTRSIEFEGEGYFRVMKNQEIPFIITSQNLQLKVLGTEFNFHSRTNQDSIVVTLSKGHVLLSAYQQSQELFKNEKAIYNKKKGTFSVEKEQNATIHWLQKELLFKNTPFRDLLATVEQEYGITIELSGGERFLQDKFSGILPSDDLEAVLEILRKSYRFNYTIKADKVFITF